MIGLTSLITDSPNTANDHSISRRLIDSVSIMQIQITSVAWEPRRRGRLNLSRSLKRRAAGDAARLGFVAASDSMLPVLRQALKAPSGSDVTILIEGELGTGKQVLAHAIYQLDPKPSSFPFVTAHGSTINESLAEASYSDTIGERSHHPASHLSSARVRQRENG